MVELSTMQLVFLELCVVFLRFFVSFGDGIIFLAKKIAAIFIRFLRGIVHVIAAIFTWFFVTIWVELARWTWGLFKPRPKRKTLLSINYYLLLYRIRYFIFGVVVTAVIIFAVSLVQFVNNLPNLSLLEQYNTGLSTHIYDRNGKLLYELFREQNRTPVKLDTLPSYVYNATVAIEDKDFYRHSGVALTSGILRAAKENVSGDNGKLQGGSTITQQLVKSALLTPQRTVERKVKEIILALMVERKYTKKQILEMYINQVPYGGTAWGIEEAAKLYFGKQARDLTVAQAAVLAGLPQAPSSYSPFTNPEAAKRRQKDVLSRLYSEHYITKQQYDDALKEKITFKSPENTILAPHFVFYVKDILEHEYGARRVQEGGLNVYTTLDYSLQEKAQKILQNELASLQGYNVGNGAILVTRPSTGEILAMVGSRDFFQQGTGAFNVTTALRQPGSSIKPFTYLLALKNGISPATLINDAPVKFDSYAPVNYDSKFHGQVPVRYALANSYNIPAVLLLKQVGVENFVRFGTLLGLKNWEGQENNFGLSLTLGGGEITMIDFATAYSALRNLGVKTNSYPIARIENSIGEVLYESDQKGTRVLREEEPFIVSDMLSDNVARTPAFGPNSALNFGDKMISVKTGTTDWKRDNWTVGYTRPTTSDKKDDILVMVWVGNNNNEPMNPALASGITGASPVWRKVMEAAVARDFFNRTLYVPATVTSKVCYYGRPEYFVLGSQDAVNCSAQKPATTPKN